MKLITIHTFEEIHHVCLMYGVKNAFGRFPFLAKNILATPPPIRRNPERSRMFLGFRQNPVNVQYYKADIFIIYNEDKADKDAIKAFSKAVVGEYLSFRHPYLKTVWNDVRLLETASGYPVAEIISESPMTDDRL